MSEVSQALAIIIEEVTASGERLTPERLRTLAWERCEPVLMSNAKALIDGRIWRIGRELCRSSDDEQQQLPGLAIPRILDIETEGETCLMRAEFAVWGELQAARSMRTLNVDRAVAALAEYDKALDRVRAAMEPFPAKTLGDAMAELGIVEISEEHDDDE
jgi:hypothetical protein